MSHLVCWYVTPGLPRCHTWPTGMSHLVYQEVTPGLLIYRIWPTTVTPSLPVCYTWVSSITPGLSVYHMYSAAMSIVIPGLEISHHTWSANTSHQYVTPGIHEWHLFDSIPYTIYQYVIYLLSKYNGWSATMSHLHVCCTWSDVSCLVWQSATLMPVGYVTPGLLICHT